MTNIKILGKLRDDREELQDGLPSDELNGDNLGDLLGDDSQEDKQINK